MFVFSNLATSVDGKIATTSRTAFPLGTPRDRRLMDVLRRRSDVILMGAETLRTWKKPLRVKGLAERRQPANAIISSRLDGISPRWPFFRDPKLRRILFVGAGTPKARIALFEKTCVVFVVNEGKGQPALARQIIAALGTIDRAKLLVEGGGGLMWEFVRENLIDEYYVTLTPRLIGGVLAPTLVDGMGFEPRDVVNVTLAKVQRFGNELYLVYRKSTKRGP